MPDKTTSVQGEAVDLWYSGKATATAGTPRPSSGPAGSRCGSRPPSRDRSTTSPPPAPRALPALYRAAAPGLPTLADPGYQGAGIGITIPMRQPEDRCDLDLGNRTRNALQRSLRCSGERAFALLTQRWRTLQHITASPSKITRVACAALVLTQYEYGYIK